MIIKEREYPTEIQKMEALLNRLGKHHKKRQELEAELTRRKTGYYGEKSTDYYFSFLPQNKYQIFHNLRLKHQAYHFQMDTLLLTQNFAVIFEVKNIKGTIRFENGQFIRTYENKDERFQNPIHQVKRHRIKLQYWMEKFRLPPLPIEYFFVNSNESSILNITNENKQVFERIINSEQIIDKVKEIEKIHTKPAISATDTKKFSNLLLKEHKLKTIDILQKFSIDQKDIITGVQCPNCNQFKMNRIYGKWSCPKCHHISKTAHEQAILDYFLLINSTMTNKECREFLHISSDKVVATLLKKMNIPTTGIKKGRVYHEPNSIIKK